MSSGSPGPSDLQGPAAAPEASSPGGGALSPAGAQAPRHRVRAAVSSVAAPHEESAVVEARCQAAGATAAAAGDRARAAGGNNPSMEDSVAQRVSKWLELEVERRQSSQKSDGAALAEEPRIPYMAAPGDASLTAAQRAAACKPAHAGASRRASVFPPWLSRLKASAQSTSFVAIEAPPTSCSCRNDDGSSRLSLPPPPTPPSPASAGAMAKARRGTTFLTAARFTSSDRSDESTGTARRSVDGSASVRGSGAKTRRGTVMSFFFNYASERRNSSNLDRGASAQDRRPSGERGGNGAAEAATGAGVGIGAAAGGTRRMSCTKSADLAATVAVLNPDSAEVRGGPYGFQRERWLYRRRRLFLSIAVARCIARAYGGRVAGVWRASLSLGPRARNASCGSKRVTHHTPLCALAGCQGPSDEAMPADRGAGALRAQVAQRVEERL